MTVTHAPSVPLARVAAVIVTYNSADVLGGLSLPYLVIGTNVQGQPAGAVTALGNTQTYGASPTAPLTRTDIPWASVRVSGAVGLAP